jgi:polyferredoxin
VAKTRKTNWVEVARPVVQLGFAAFILGSGILHHTSKVESASPHALCPFGAVETLYALITSGSYVNKVFSSSMILGVGLLLSAVLAGGVFCGWICPWGAVQDAVAWVRRKLRIPEVQVPAKVDAILRYGRFLVLAGVLYATAATATLWFTDYDPYYTLYSTRIFFEFNLATQWPALLVTIAVVGGSLLVPRLWCRYLCPLGGLLSVIQRISPIKIRRDADVCIGCGRCDKACPVALNVAHSPAVTHDCSLCMKCVDTCPAPGALNATLPQRPAAGTSQAAPAARRVTATRWVAPLAAIVILLGSAGVAQALGWWHAVGTSLSAVSNASPADIRGFATLQEVSTTFGIPREALYKLLGLPADIPWDTRLKDLESYNEVTAVREKVSAYLGLPSSAAASASATPQPAASMGAPSAPAPQTPSATGSSGARLAATEIKGTMTLQEVADQCGMPREALYQALKLPADVPATTALRDIRNSVPGFEVTLVRDAVTAYQASHP